MQLWGRELPSIPKVRKWIVDHFLSGWQIIVAMYLIGLCAVWVVLQIQLTRILLAGSLAIFTLVILLFANNRTQKTQMLALFILVYAMLFALFGSKGLVGILGVWILVMALFVIFLAVLGVYITGRPMGLFIDSRNKMSLSTLQTILWTVVILSAFFTVAAALLQAGKGTDAFNISLDQQLWALMGISVTTLAGTPLIKDVKSQRTVKTGVLREYARRHEAKVLARALQMDKVTRDPGQTDKELFKALLNHEKALREVLAEFMDGPLCKENDPMTVSVLDIFRGDELVNCRRVDLGKVQMFFFTVIGALAYMVVLADWIATLKLDTAAIAFPVLSQGFIAILGISHAGFLGNTAVPKTPEATPPA